MHTDHLTEHLQDSENLKAFQQERLLIDVATAIYRTMKKKQISRKELAEALEVSKGRISQYLGGELNLTLRTLADIFTAMDSRVAVIIDDLSMDGGEWREITDMQKIVRWSNSFSPPPLYDAECSLGGAA